MTWKKATAGLVRDPFYCCPICGAWARTCLSLVANPEGLGDEPQHRCDEGVLRRRDARDRDSGDPAPRPYYDAKLAAGFRLFLQEETWKDWGEYFRRSVVPVVGHLNGPERPPPPLKVICPVEDFSREAPRVGRPPKRRPSDPNPIDPSLPGGGTG